MSLSVAFWNGLGESWFAWLVERSLASAVALGVVLVLLLLLPRRRLSAHLPSYLLLLPLLVLVVPVERLLPRSFPRPLPAFDDATLGGKPAPPAPLPPSRAAYADSDPATGPLPPAPADASPGLQWQAQAMTVWCLLLAGGVLRLWQRQRTSQRRLDRSSRPAEARLMRRFSSLSRAAGVRRDVALRLSRGVPSPLVGGIRRPTVYLPHELVIALAPAQLHFVLRHELEHIRRHDVLLGTLTSIVRIAFCFHPGVWLTTELLARWREYACDEAALARAATGAHVEIAETLFTLVERACGATPPVPANALLLSPRKFMQHRLLRILDSNRRPHARLSIPAAVLLALTSVGALTAARAQQAVPTPTRSDAGTTAGVPGRDAVATALDEAAAWLLQNQLLDGSWAICPDPTGANQRDHNPVCVTAMAVRALLPGLKDQKLKIAQAVRRATAFLEQSQQENGRFGPDDAMTMMYAHAQVLRALCAVQREWPEDQRLARIAGGVAYALKARNPYSGWRYEPRCGDNDSKITGMMLLGLHAAKDVGVAVDQAALTEATRLLDQLTDKTSGRTGFTRQGGPMSRFTSKQALFPGKYSEEPTALTLLVRVAAGQALADPLCRRGVGLIAAVPPVWDLGLGSIDLAYWEFGAQVMAGVGGPQAEDWRRALNVALIPNRIVADGAAHWPAVDAWSHPGMEAYTTASAMLALRALR